ncbi:helix-turn-helix transcriptional regulator [Streptomyces capparidis]
MTTAATEGPAPRATAPGADRPATDSIRRRELAAFLRSRRERLTPEQVGLPRGPRRRTPGLRREEVAQLAAVGVTWYTWLEQARDIRVSAQVLDSVARALRLNPNERAHLFVLAGTPDPVPGLRCPSVTPALMEILEQLEPVPACLQNSRYDIVAYNRTYGLMLGDLDRVPPEDRNLLWLAFTRPEWREAMVDWEESVAVMTAKFRASMAEHLAEPGWKCLVSRLREASPTFCELWERHEVVQPDNRGKCYLNPFVGVLNLELTSLWLGPRPGPRLTVHVPKDEETARRLAALHTRALAPAA